MRNYPLVLCECQMLGKIAMLCMSHNVLMKKRAEVGGPIKHALHLATNENSGCMLTV